MPKGSVRIDRTPRFELKQHASGRLWLEGVSTSSRATHAFLFGTKIRDPQVKELAELRHVTYLALGNTLVTDVGLKELGRMEQLEFLDLRHTKATDAGLKELIGLKKLKR